MVYLFQPHLVVARDAIRSLRLPLWDPAIGAGRPLGAQQGGPFFPINWIAYVLPFWAALGWIAWAKIVLAGTGMAALARTQGLGVPARLLAAVAFAFSTVFVGFIGHGQTDAYALVPWMLVVAERIVRNSRLADGALLALLFGASIYNGHPESAVLAVLLTYVYFAWTLASEARAGGRVLRQISIAIGAGALGAGVGALMIVPTLELLGQSGGQTSRAVAGFTSSLRDLGVGFAFPELFGQPDKVILQVSSSPGSTLFQARPYLGTLTPLLAIAGLVVRRPSGRQLFFVAVALVSLLAVIAGPVHTLLGHLPVLSDINLGELIFPLTLSVALLGGFGLDRLLKSDRRGRRRALVTTGILGAVAVAIVLASRPHALSSMGSALHDVPRLASGEGSIDNATIAVTLRFVIIVAAFLLGIVAAARRRRLMLLGLAVVAITALDLLLIDYGFQPAFPKTQVDPPAPLTLTRARESGPLWRVAGTGGALSPDLAERYGVADARAEDLPSINRYTRLFTTLGGTYNRGFGETLLTSLGPSQRKLLDLFSVRWVFADRPRPATGMRLISAAPGDSLLENLDAFPRARLVYAATRVHDLNAALSVIAAAPVSRLRDVAVIEGGGSEPSSALRGAQASQPKRVDPAPSSAARMLESTATRIEISVTARQAGWLVLSDTFYPGWKASVDDRPARILPADGAFRAVAVTRGHHRVVFSYSSASADAGLALTIAGLAIAFGVLAILAVREKIRRGARAERADGLERRG